jgi:hypothetical protein
VFTLLALIRCSTGVPSQSNKTGERKKWHSNSEGRSQLIPFLQMILYQKDAKNTKKLLDVINTFSKVARYKIIIKI